MGSTVASDFQSSALSARVGPDPLGPFEALATAAAAGPPDRTVGPRTEPSGGQRCVGLSGDPRFACLARRAEETEGPGGDGGPWEIASAGSRPPGRTRGTGPGVPPDRRDGTGCPAGQDRPSAGRAGQDRPSAGRAGQGHQERPFACGVPGPVLGTWVSSTRLDKDERLASRERLVM